MCSLAAMWLWLKDVPAALAGLVIGAIVVRWIDPEPYGWVLGAFTGVVVAVMIQRALNRRRHTKARHEAPYHFAIMLSGNDGSPAARASAALRAQLAAPCSRGTTSNSSIPPRPRLWAGLPTATCGSSCCRRQHPCRRRSRWSRRFKRPPTGSSQANCQRALFDGPHETSNYPCKRLRGLVFSWQIRDQRATDDGSCAPTTQLQPTSLLIMATH
jgi:hypothetical protein